MVAVADSSRLIIAVAPPLQLMVVVAAPLRSMIAGVVELVFVHAVVAARVAPQL